MKLRKLFPCCLPRPDEDAYLQPLTLFQPRANGSTEEVLEASSRAREECWQRIGSLEPLVLSHLVNPALMGGPRWPAMRQASGLRKSRQPETWTAACCGPLGKQQAVCQL